MITSRKKRRALLAAALVAVTGGLITASQSQAALPGSAFEGNDGNIVANGGIDWENLPNVSVGTDAQTGTCDSSYTQGSKEDDTNVVIGQGSIPNSKADIGKFAVGSETKPNGHVYMYLAWVRNNDSGSTNFDFEINQQAQPNMTFPVCPPQAPDRAITLNRIGNALPNGNANGGVIDDLLISYDLAGGANIPTLSFRRWTGTAWSDAIPLAPPLSEGKTNCVTSATCTNGAGALPPSAVFGAAIPADRFGEGAIDMTEAGIIQNQNDPNAPCVGFGSAYVKSRASNSFPAQMKDYVPPVAIGLNTCGSITIDKVTAPTGSTQSFNFDGTPAAPKKQLTDFALADATAPKVYSNLTPGQYEVTEAAVTGWDLTNLVCVSSGGANVVTNVISGGTVTINLDPKENVTCTYTNTQRGRVIIDKVTQPDPDPTNTLFDYTGSFGAFSLHNKVGNPAVNETFDSGLVVPGPYSVLESAETGWTPNGSTCNDANSTNAGSINVEPGETVTCTFDNIGYGKIIVIKHTNPVGSGQSFEFDTSYGANFSLTDGMQNDSGALAPGSGYSVDELTPTGWDETAATCSGGDSPTNITISPGETVTCDFTNTQRGQIIVTKLTSPSGAEQQFSFTPGGYNGGAAFLLGDGQSFPSELLVPGAGYSVSETVPNGWENLSATCSGENTPASITVDPGEVVNCVFTNEQDSHIIVFKHTDPIGDPQSFGFTTTGTGDSDETPYLGFSLTDGTFNDSGPLDPGTYSVAENTPSGWTLTNATCDAGSEDPASITLSPGQTVTCDFYNLKGSNIIIRKVVQGPDNAGSFHFTTNYGAAFNLGNGGSNASGNLVPGSYNASEAPQDNWLLLSATCLDGQDPADITLLAGQTVDCTFTNEWQVGSILVNKASKDAAQGPGDHPQAGMSFTVHDNVTGDSFQVGPTDASGNVCVGPLAFGTNRYTVDEVAVPGYANLPSQTFTVNSVSHCDSDYGGESVPASFVNIPLTDVTITVDSLIDGATSSVINCYDKDGNLLDTKTASDGSLYIPGLEPTDPEVLTMHCDFFIDP